MKFFFTKNNSKEFVGNLFTDQFHKKNCFWVDKMNDDHKCYFDNIEDALKNNYDGCAFCLPEYHNYKGERLSNDQIKEEQNVCNVECGIAVNNVDAKTREEISSIIRVVGANPMEFERNTYIEFELSEAVNIDINIINQETNVLVCSLKINQYFSQGRHRVEWDGNNEEGEQVVGIYKCQIKSAEEHKTIENLKKTLNYFPSIIYNQDLDKGCLKDTHVAYSILSYKDNFSREDAIDLAKTESVNKLFFIFAGQQGFMGKEANLINEDMDDLFCVDLTGGDKYIKEGDSIWKGTYKILTSNSQQDSTASRLFDTFRNDGLVVDVLNTKYEWDKKTKKKDQILDNLFATDINGLGELIESFIQKPDGKIFICGFSRGAIFSLKVAQRLKELYNNNHKIQAVVTIDPVINPLSKEWSFLDENNLVKHFCAHMKKLQKTPYQKSVKDKYVSGYFEKTVYYKINWRGKKVKKTKRKWIQGYWTYKNVTRYRFKWITKWYSGISGAEIIAKGIFKMLLDPLGIFTSQDSRLLIYRLRFPLLKKVPGVSYYNVFQRLALQNFETLQARKTPIGSAIDGAISPFEDNWYAQERRVSIKPVDKNKPYNQYDVSIEKHTPDMLKKYWYWIYDIALRKMT